MPTKFLKPDFVGANTILQTRVLGHLVVWKNHPILKNRLLSRWSRWWQLKYFFFHLYLEKWSNLTIIFFKWVGKKPPTSGDFFKICWVLFTPKTSRKFIIPHLDHIDLIFCDWWPKKSRTRSKPSKKSAVHNIVFKDLGKAPPLGWEEP